MINPPQGTINHKMVLNYSNNPVLYFELEKGVVYSDCLKEQIRSYKIKYLEEKLGYKLERLEDIIPHDEYVLQKV